ncbi:MAG TPA: replicative DNA helicase [Usitatibacter sp.]|jgi:replicative DNA helicase|nr:replicative DNA helicase [Usitatibacter sp.]
MPSAPAGSERFGRPGAFSGDAQIESLRLPPHSVEAEQAVLGGLLLSNQSWDRIGDLIAPSDFYRADHRILWGAITKLIEDNKPADVLTVSEALKIAGELQDVGGLAYLHQLATGTPSAANIRRYAEIVRERSIMRKLAEVGTNIADSAYSPQGREAKQLLDEAETRILEIGESGGRSNESFQTMSQMLSEVMSRLDELHKNPNAVTGKATGFVDLDEITTGLQDGDLVIVAGRPAMGKAQPLEARIKTPRGWTTMGALQVGDAIASIDGQPSIVVGVYPQGVRQVYRVTFSDGRSAEACAEHLWRIHSSGSEPRTVQTEELIGLLAEVRGGSGLWVDPISGDFGHRDDLPVDPWLLGTLLAEDKHFDRTTARAPARPQMLEELMAEDGHDVVAPKVITRDYALSPAVRAGLAVTQGAQFVPLIYRNARKEARLALLQGVLDNRATVERSGAIHFSASHYGLAKDVQDLVRSLGGWCALTVKSASCDLEIHHPEPRTLFRLALKRDRLPERDDLASRVTITSIVPSRLMETQCVAVSHATHLYLTDEYVVTHNTSFALNVAEHVALELRLPVLVFSMEMGGTQLATRMLGSVGKVDAQKLRTGRLDPHDWDRLGSALGKLNEAPLLIDESPGLNPLELRSRARRKWREYGGLGLIVVDYIQLMQGTEGNQENRATELSEISRGMKQMAKELKVPVIALSQLNRSLEQRPNKRPVMSDLRECVTGDTLVMLADGRRVPIRELVGTTPEVLAMSPEGKIHRAHSDCVWSKGVKPILKVSLASGRTIRATAEHRLFGPNGWVHVGELKMGDRVALSRRLPEPEKTIRWRDEEVVLLGHLVGDGSYLSHQPLRYTTASEENGEAVRAAAAALGSEVKRYRGRGLWHQLLISGNGNRWHPEGVGKWLKDLGIYGQRSHEKRLPQEVFQLADDQVGLLLRHLWATDGSIVVRKPGQKGSQRAYFSTSSKALAHDVAALLMRLGIVARLRCSIKAGYRPCYAVDVTGHENQTSFLDKVGAFGPRVGPAARLKAYLASCRPNTNVDTLPVEAIADLRAVMAAQGVSGRAMHRMRGTAYGGTVLGTFAPSRSLIDDYAKKLDDESLRRWSRSDIFWDRVVSVEPAGEEEVFDLTVPGLASWIADGIFSHNSGALEQDADMIIFIYRDEVYNEDSPDKGIAEIIIGKQRNGPIGTVKLTFLGKHTRFENYSGAQGGY